MRKWKNIVAVCAAMVMTVSLTACAGKEENEGIHTLEPIEMETESQKEETDKETQEIGSQEAESPEDAVTEEKLDTERKDAGQNVNEAAKNNVEKTTNATEEPVVSGEANTVPQQSAETPAIDQQNSQQTQNVSVPSTTIVGSIKSIGDGSFTISKADIDSNVMVSTDETVNVVYSDSTEFEVTRSSDGGITASYAAGTSTDLKKERIVHVEGAYDGSSFVAQKITIRIFE